MQIASQALDLNVLSVVDAFESLAAHAKRELDTQSSLLANLSQDLELIRRVKVHSEFVKKSEREKGRTLGDYVSEQKMLQVAEGCRVTHAELRARYLQVEEVVSRLSEGADGVREAIMSTK